MDVASGAGGRSEKYGCIYLCEFNFVQLLCISQKGECIVMTTNAVMIRIYVNLLLPYYGVDIIASKADPEKYMNNVVTKWTLATSTLMYCSNLGDRERTKIINTL